MYLETLERIFKINLGVKEDERVLVFTDLIDENEAISADEKGRREVLVGIARDIAEAGESL